MGSGSDLVYQRGRSVGTESSNCQVPTEYPLINKIRGGNLRLKVFPGFPALACTTHRSYGRANPEGGGDRSPPHASVEGRGCESAPPLLVVVGGGSPVYHAGMGVESLLSLTTGGWSVGRWWVGAKFGRWSVVVRLGVLPPPSVSSPVPWLGVIVRFGPG